MLDNPSATERPWPFGCLKPSGCESRRACGYDGCRHAGRDIGSAVDAAVAGREAEIADPKTICSRLRGVYTVPVNDGCGPLNGSMEFTRWFETPPIQRAAAARIEQLETVLRDVVRLLGADRAMEAAETVLAEAPLPSPGLTGWLSLWPDGKPYGVRFVRDETAAWAWLAGERLAEPDELQEAGWSVRRVGISE